MHQYRIHAFARYAIFFVLLGIVMSGGLEPCAAQNDKPVNGKKNVLILFPGLPIVYAVQKEGISRVLAVAVVIFGQPTLWDEHRGLIIGIVTVLAVQTSLIAGLLRAARVAPALRT